MSPFKQAQRWLLRTILYPIFAPYVRMPGTSLEGDLPPPTTDERHMAILCKRHVTALSVDIGERCITSPLALSRTVHYIAGELRAMGLEPRWEDFEVDGQTLRNVYVDVPGTSSPDEIIVVGAHYDTTCGTAGADDNGTGVAATLELARILKEARLPRTVRFAFFANEEDIGMSWDLMGSFHHARESKARGEKLIAMLSLEMLGYFSDQPGSQKYPFPFNLFYPDKGNFIAFVGNTKSRSLVCEVVEQFRTVGRFPSEGVAAPERYSDISRSDHWAFWQFGCPALMITDTSNFRYPFLHTNEDTPDKLNFEKMARIVCSLIDVIKRLSDPSLHASGK